MIIQADFFKLQTVGKIVPLVYSKRLVRSDGTTVTTAQFNIVVL